MNETISKRLCQTYELNISAYVDGLPNYLLFGGLTQTLPGEVNIFLYNLLDILFL